jgi:3',5'-cyclic AMP phosphodiesterase CpdA
VAALQCYLTVTTRKDFFVSYTKADRAWARWIAWQLQAAGWSVVLDVWDFDAGCNWVVEMDRAARQAERTVLVLSPDLLESSFPVAEWAAAFAGDPRGQKRRLVPVRVRECRPEGLLGQVVYLDLVGISDSAAATKLLLDGLRGETRPATEPPFPAATTTDEPRFPGAVQAVDLVHLADLRIGAHVSAADLRQALAKDLGQLEADGYLDPQTPRLITVTGDVADTATPAEYRQAMELLTGLAVDLDVPPGRIVVVPGNHDVSWLKCRHMFEECEAYGETPTAPYFQKYGPWQRFFNDLYQELPAAQRKPVFNEKQPWTTYTFPDLDLQVIGLNSCWLERHGEDEEHFGWVDLDSLTAMLDAIRVSPQPMKVALAHHHPMPDQVRASAALRNGQDVIERLAERGVGLVLCAHGHPGEAVGIHSPDHGRQVAVVAGATAESEGIQYQVVQLRPEPRLLRRRSDRIGGRFDADPVDKRWRWPLPAWVTGAEATEDGPSPTLDAVTDAYRDHCRRAYQELTGALYRRRDQVAHPLISEVFVELKVQAEVKEEETEGEAEVMARQAGSVTIDQYLEQTEAQPLLLAGSAGSGKTTYLRHRLGRWVEGGGRMLTVYVPLGRLGDHLAAAAAGNQRLWSAVASFLADEHAPFSADQAASRRSRRAALRPAARPGQGTHRRPQPGCRPAGDSHLATLCHGRCPAPAGVQPASDPRPR